MPDLALEEMLRAADGNSLGQACRCPRLCYSCDGQEFESNHLCLTWLNDRMAKGLCPSLSPDQNKQAWTYQAQRYKYQAPM